MKDISLIILAYNDANSLITLIPNAYSVLAANFNRFELIIVDDCSTDNTTEVVESFKKDYNNIVYEKNPVNRGVGYAFEKGVSLAKLATIAYTDGDGQFNINDLLTLYKYIGEFDIVTGNREIRADGFKRLLISKTYNLLLRLLFGMNIKDTNSALKIYNREIFRNILPLSSYNGFYDAEVIIKSMRLNYKIKEISITHYPRKFGVASGVKWKSMINVLKSTINFWYVSKR